jgi:hypothetical protein
MKEPETQWPVTDGMPHRQRWHRFHTLPVVVIRAPQVQADKYA